MSYVIFIQSGLHDADGFNVVIWAKVKPLFMRFGADFTLTFIWIILRAVLQYQAPNHERHPSIPNGVLFAICDIHTKCGFHDIDGFNDVILDTVNPLFMRFGKDFLSILHLIRHELRREIRPVCVMLLKDAPL